MGKKRKTGRILLLAMLSCLLMFLLTGCGEECTVTIQDMQETTEITANTRQKVKDVLEDAEITLGEKDETDPGLDEKVSNGMTIVIKRYAAVTVVDAEGAEHPVECVGGTVSDALKEAGITLEKGQVVDAEEDTFLTDGMTITVTQQPAVKLTVDGKSNTVYTGAKTVEEFLAEQNVTLGKNDRVSPKKSEAIEDGMKIVVQRVEIKEETVTENIPYSSETQNSSSLAAGTTQVKQSGQNGSKEVTYKITYVDGKEQSREVINEKVTKEAVNEIIVKGTMQPSSSSSSSSGGSSGGSSSGSSGGKSVVSTEYYDDCDGSGHGIKVITYSDGSMEEVPY